MALKALEAGDTNTVKTVLQIETTMTAWMLPVYEREVNISEMDREAGRLYAHRVLDYLETAIPEKRIARQPAEHALRGLDYLIASRYHACVLSLGAAVPQLAIAHDERIGSFYRELGLAEEFLLSHAAGQLPAQLRAAFTRLLPIC